MKNVEKSVDCLGKDIHFHILTKKDIEKELGRTDELFGMTPDEFYNAWREGNKEGKFHGFLATKLAIYYELYQSEYGDKSRPKIDNDGL